MSEWLGRMVQQGRIRLRKTTGRVSYHDPCQAGRRGGIFDPPRRVVEALGLDLVEFKDTKQYGWCCGGGGGVLANERAEPLRYKAFKIKMDQVEETGAEKVVSACHQCHITFEKAKAHFKWEIPFENLVDLVAAHLDDGAREEVLDERARGG